MPTPHSFLRAALSYIFLYMSIIITLAFLSVQVGEVVSFVTNLTTVFYQNAPIGLI
jgi:hypothetical protein